jgi:hypothetical protein
MAGAAISKNNPAAKTTNRFVMGAAIYEGDSRYHESGIGMVIGHVELITSSPHSRADRQTKINRKKKRSLAKQLNVSR